MRIIKFCFTTLNRNLVIDNFQLQDECLGQVTFWAFVLEVWNDYHTLGMVLSTWHPFNFFLQIKTNLLEENFINSWLSNILNYQCHSNFDPRHEFTINYQSYLQEKWKINYIYICPFFFFLPFFFYFSSKFESKIFLRILTKK